MADDAQETIDGYLNVLRARLAGVNETEVREILAELRSHVVERATVNGEMTKAAVDAALARLGSPESLAAEYVTGDLLARAEVSRTPWRVLDSLFRWASLSASGALVLVASMLGYFLGAVFLLSAVLKPFHPHAAGLWIVPDPAGDAVFSLRMGFEGPPAGAHDVLGFWIVPAGLVAGALTLILTTRFALWSARRYRMSILSKFDRT